MPCGSPATTRRSARPTAPISSWAASWACSSGISRSPVTWAASGGDLVGEGRDEGVVAGPPVFPEQVGQQQVREAARRRPPPPRRGCRPQPPCPGRTRCPGRPARSWRRRRRSGVLPSAAASTPGQRDVAALDLVVGLGAVDAGQVEHRVDARPERRPAVRVGEVIPPDADGAPTPCTARSRAAVCQPRNPWPPVIATITDVADLGQHGRRRDASHVSVSHRAPERQREHPLDRRPGPTGKSSAP